MLCGYVFYSNIPIKYIYNILFILTFFFSKSMYLNEFHIQGHVIFKNILYS